MNYSFTQLEQFAAQAGFPTALQPIMAAIALAESGGNPGAVNPNDNGGRQSSFGLWQISTGTHAAPSPAWSNPLVNAQLAYQKYQTQGLSAWGTYTSGAYRQYLNAANAGTGIPSDTLAFSSVSGVPGLSDIQNAISSTLAPITGLSNSLGAFWNAVSAWITKPWRIVKLAAGAFMLIGVGVALATGSDAGKATVKMGKQVGSQLAAVAS